MSPRTIIITANSPKTYKPSKAELTAIRIGEPALAMMKAHMRMAEVLAQTSHRPWPRPQSPWLMTQCWRDLLFAHWPVEPQTLRPLVPECLELDLFDGSAYVAVVPFHMTGIRARLLPPLRGASAFPELNLRTYVRPKRGPIDRPGVFFWSLEATNALAVATARRFFHLPYMNATMSCQERDGWFHYKSERTRQGAPAAVFRGRYRPLHPTKPNALTDFLTERYCLYSVDAHGEAHAAEVHHARWPLFDAEAVIEESTIAQAAGIQLHGPPPLLHFAKSLEVAIWGLRKV